MKVTPRPTLYCVNLDSLHPLLQGNRTVEKSLRIEYCMPKNIIVDPNTSILKADLLKTIGHHYGLSKIAINTHFLPQIKNYPLSAGELKSQWSLSDGGNYFILAFRNQENEAQCWLTEKID